MAKTSSESLDPGSTIGILGGGQLGRMTATAASRLGYIVHIYSPDEDAPAKQVSSIYTTASYDDVDKLSSFAQSVDVVTFEFENIPIESLLAIQNSVLIRPGYRALEVAQDRLIEKRFMSSLGIRTTDFWPVLSIDELESALVSLNGNGVFKSARFGYDGKNQIRVSTGDPVGPVWGKMGVDAGILERWVDYLMEISVIVARSSDGEVVVYDPVQNHHENYMLSSTLVPAPINLELVSQSCEIARQIAEALNLVGVLAVEMFVTEENELLVNEIAPRPHNSGHWTIDACACSQFEQLVRAVCGVPLGTARRHSNAKMHNLIGDEIEQWEQLLREPGAIVHLYGKSEARRGRKMGHVTRLMPL